MHKFRNQADGVVFASADAGATGAEGAALAPTDSAGIALSSFCNQGSVLSVVLSRIDLTYSGDIGAAALPHSERI
jgi:hypothetical protein